MSGGLRLPQGTRCFLPERRARFLLEAEEPAESDEQQEKEPAEVTAEKTADDASAEEVKSEEDASDVVDGAETNGGLRNRRTSGKITLRRRKRSRGGVAVED